MKLLKGFVCFCLVAIFSFGTAFSVQAAPKSTSVKATGIFQGLADNHCFEVKIDGKAIVVRFNDDRKVEKLREGDSIILTYWVNIHGQNILGTTLTQSEKKP